MAASGVFSITRDQVITAALQLCGAIAKDESADGTDITDCVVYLQAMLKYWDTEGKKAWLFKTILFPCVIGKQTYTIGNGGDIAEDRPVSVMQAFTYDSANNKTPMLSYTREQWERLTPNPQTGPSNIFYYDPQLVLGKLNFWPVPNDTTHNYGIVVQRPISDIGAIGTATFDVPQEAYLALIWGLAEQIMSLYGTEENTQKRIEKNAAKYVEVFSSFSEEEGSLFFQPNPQGGVNYGR